MPSAASRKVSAPEHRRGDGKHAARIALPSLDERQQAAAIGVTDFRQRAVRPPHREHEVDHARTRSPSSAGTGTRLRAASSRNC